MPTALLAITFINGVELGLLYALIAVGFSLIYGAGRILFCGHGEIYMIAALSAFLLIERVDLPFFPTMFIVMMGTGALGLLLERFMFRRFYGRPLVVFMLSLGLAMLIANLSLYIFGGDIRGITTPFPGYVAAMGIRLPIDKLVVIGIAIAMIVGLNWFLNNVKAGQTIRAVAQDPDAAALQGIDKNRSMQLVFFLGLALAGGAAVLVAPLYYVDVFLGTPALLNTFIVVILGGIGSFPGAVAGGLFLGILQSFTGVFIGGLTTLVSFIVVIIFLVVRPRGFFGRE